MLPSPRAGRSMSRDGSRGPVADDRRRIGEYGVVTSTRATMLPTLVPPTTELPERTRALRAQVREFLAAELAAGAWNPRVDVWLSGWDERFSRELARRG